MKHILWTGGWDSTFRVIELVLINKQEIQPYYIFDDNRSSTTMELQAIENIKNAIHCLNKQTTNLIRDLQIVNKSSIPENKAITDAYHRLKNTSFIGSQYDWLARFMATQKTKLELCVHQDDTVNYFLKPNVIKSTANSDELYTLPETSEVDDLTLVFGYYTFPILHLTKLEMQEISLKNGYSELMQKTWFCHRPTNKGLPCGLCNPCQYTIQEGLGHRVPKPTLAAKLKNNFHKSKKLLKQITK